MKKLAGVGSTPPSPSEGVKNTFVLLGLRDQSRGGQNTARGPHAARQSILCGPHNYIVNTFFQDRFNFYNGEIIKTASCGIICFCVLYIVFACPVRVLVYRFVLYYYRYNASVRGGGQRKIRNETINIHSNSLFVWAT